jgi:RNA polymerase sigma-70 factor (ECF subfamily)
VQQQDDDDALMEAAGRGDERAFNRLVARHSPRIYAIARRYLGEHADADEATQEVFWRVWRAGKKWRRGEAQLGTWLYRVTVNICLDRKRGAARRQEVSAEAAILDLPDPAPHQDDRMAGRQTLRAMLETVFGLPDEQRMALILSVQQNLSNREIAGALAISEGAVEQLLVRARRTLRTAYRSLK